VEFFEAMGLDGLDVILAGHWRGLAQDSPLRKYLAHDEDQCLDNIQAAGVYRSARAGINFYRREADEDCQAEGWAMGPREVEMAASGLFFLRDPRGEGDELLPMLPTFGSPADAGTQLRWWLGHDGHRQEAARKAREAVADRTFHNHAKRLLQLLER
jgi:spore maturation protein CgeB